MRAALSGTLIALCLCLGTLLIYEIHAPLPDYFVPPARPVPVRPLHEQSAFVMRPSIDFAEIPAKLLFNPDRIPFKDPEPASQQRRLLPPPQLLFVGVILDTKEKIAVARIAGSQSATDLRLGQNVAGWTLESIWPDRIQLRADTQRLEIKIRSGAPLPGDRLPAKTSPNLPVAQADSR